MNESALTTKYQAIRTKKQNQRVALHILWMSGIKHNKQK